MPQSYVKQARLGTTLAKRSVLAYSAGGSIPERLKTVLSLADSAVILKTYRNAAAIHEVLGAFGGNGEVRFASRLGLEGEMTAKGLDNVPEKPHYLYS
jgi:precorrin-2/cobalt-factor-2 C20-methyltransferase